jgi:uncharacterized membrane protein
MRRWYPAFLIAATAIASAIAYPRLPDTVPSHWNLHGQVNGWQSRGRAAFLMPVIMLVLWGVLRGLPAIDPRRANYAKFQPTYDFMIGAVLTLVALIHLVVLAAGLGAPISIHRVIPIAIGVVLIAVGNQLPRARSNWWFGIRTPWTLSNERVWERTHRVGGYLMSASGVATIIGGLVASELIVPIVIICVVGFALGSVIYSYFAWRQETSR